MRRNIVCAISISGKNNIAASISLDPSGDTHEYKFENESCGLCAHKLMRELHTLTPPNRYGVILVFENMSDAVLFLNEISIARANMITKVINLQGALSTVKYIKHDDFPDAISSYAMEYFLIRDIPTKNIHRSEMLLSVYSSLIGGIYNEDQD